jgi:hypothetical protein
LIKIALNGKLNSDTPRYHYILTTGAVGNTLRQQLRQEKYTDLKNECNKLIQKGDFKPLVASVQASGHCPISTINDYIDSLIGFYVWSAVDFDNELTIVWNDISNILDKHFALDVLIREYPRANFDFSRYKKEHTERDLKLIPLSFQFSALPSNIEASSFNQGTLNINSFSLKELYDHTDNLGLNIITSLGGGGKSKSLELLRQTLLKNTDDSKIVIPVFIRLRGYSKNSLDTLIKQELDIQVGFWQSLPYSYVFLFDGLDEMLDTEVQAFLDEVKQLLSEHKVFVTFRDVGLGIPVIVDSVNYCIEVKSLSYRDALNIAELVVAEDKLDSFYQSVRGAFSKIGFEFINRPFGLQKTIEYYNANNQLPDSFQDVLKDSINKKILNEKSRVNTTTAIVNRIDTGYIRKIISYIVYEFRIERGLVALNDDQYLDVLQSAYEKLSVSERYAIFGLNFQDFLQIVRHFDILKKGDDSLYSTEHDIISDFLAADVLAKNWEKKIKEGISNVGLDCWLFATNYIDESELSEYQASIFSVNIILGARVTMLLDSSYFDFAEELLLKADQSNSILYRSNAIVALGILKTPRCIQRLASNVGLKDVHHKGQRTRSLCFAGDKVTLKAALEDNEPLMQFSRPSGGSYDTWFASPPIVITDIAKERINDWKKNPKTNIAMSLNTLALYGDRFDVDSLIDVLLCTESDADFNVAVLAIKEIAPHLLVKSLERVVAESNSKRFKLFAKVSLNNLNEIVDVSDDFKNFLDIIDDYSSMPGGAFSIVDNIVGLISNQKLPEGSSSLLFSSYKNLPIEHYLMQKLWMVAIAHKMTNFSNESTRIINDNGNDKIMLALNYLLQAQSEDFCRTFSPTLEDYYKNHVVEVDNYVGVKIAFSKIHLKINEKEKAADILNGLLSELLPNEISSDYTYEEYNTRGFDFRVSAILEEAMSIKEFINPNLIMKLMLIDFKHITGAQENKLELIKMLSKSDLKTFLHEIKDWQLKMSIMLVATYAHKDFLTINDIEPFLPALLSHHYYHTDLAFISKLLWSDEFANLFLQAFVKLEWNSVNIQMFEKYISHYANFITVEQLNELGAIEKYNLPSSVVRIYTIWSELLQ